MKTKVTVSYPNEGSSYQETIDISEICPHCGRTLAPKVYKAFSNDSHYDFLQTIGVLAQCTYENCQKFYALQYISEGGLENIYPVNLSYRPEISVDFPEDISEVSKVFVEIYSQATVAESEMLNQIAGVGYRKSLEFLIKDYAILKNPKEEEQIKSKLLGPVIANYLGDFPKIQNLAKAATWIGNDETHYTRRHDDKDIKDMKQFILSTAQFIAADYHADLASKFIND